MTKELFRADGYLKNCSAIVTDILGKGFVVDKTVFYPMGGGQPGDTGTFAISGQEAAEIVDCYVDRESGKHLHLVDDEAALPRVGDTVELNINWRRRHRLMRVHSCLHMLCAAIPEQVTGGSIGEGSGRLDFDMPEPPDKLAIEEKVNALIRQDAPMSMQWISDQELDAQPELVRTMSVQPPKGSGSVRLIDFNGIDLQPCGGTHVSRTGEIGEIRIVSIKKKGKQNRRITVELLDGAA